jgi:hypothetical protein
MTKFEKLKTITPMLLTTTIIVGYCLYRMLRWFWRHADTFGAPPWSWRDDD